MPLSRKARWQLIGGAGLLLLVGAIAVGYASRGHWICRRASCESCQSCCRKAGFGISACGSRFACACDHQADLVDETGTIQLREGQPAERHRSP